MCTKQVYYVPAFIEHQTINSIPMNVGCWLLAVGIETNRVHCIDMLQYILDVATFVQTPSWCFFPFFLCIFILTRLSFLYKCLLKSIFISILLFRYYGCYYCCCCCCYYVGPSHLCLSIICNRIFIFDFRHMLCCLHVFLLNKDLLPYIIFPFN